MNLTKPDSSVVQLAVDLACRAPSLHNSQPWRWTYADGRLQLFGDHRRLLRAADPTGRQLHISCGAALDHLRVGLLGLRWSADIHYEDRGVSPNLFATVEFRHDARPRSHDFDMLAAIRRRRTDRRAFGMFDAIDELTDCVAEVGRKLDVGVTVMDSDQRAGLLRATEASAAARRYDSEYQAELHWWAGHSMSSGGIPETSLVSGGGSVPIARTFPARRNAEMGDQGAIDESTVLAIGTTTDTRRDWLRCGQVLSSILLEATVRGAATCPLSHMTEVPGSRALLNQLVPEVGVPQMLVRIGRAPGGTPPVMTTRRLMSEVLTVT
ncbi:hypothetical protein O4214_14675 [Rhodococcus erythropolis]|uniref:Acg family FMN-binding oxidoreductase n=1 Tax=Rhodococcus erythropolis TaxID=1833 RepID=UPI001E56C3A7|nr:MULTISPECIES: hypothetical protein [Rhodococcus erythropolis group]MCD2104640.1 hypothetical protein [Rhodococcus qingshengii]MCZ4525234.1 hypothetical protein [Rhodococcus erythropolis]